MPEVVFIFPIVKTDQIRRALETLYQYTDRSKFKVIVVDQSMPGMTWYNPAELPTQPDMIIRMKNQGFSTAANEGIIHALKWNTPYIAVCNDDIEFMYNGWWEDLLEEFKTDEKIIAIAPESPRQAAWGYGLDHDKCIEILPYKESYSPQDIAYLKQGDYNGEEIQSRHPFAIPKSFPLTKRGVVDGMAMWMPVFKREAFIELGLFEERFVWGGGEDYDMLARAYSCAWPIPRDECDPKYHRRMVSTMKSWVWHWWGQSKDNKEKLDPKLFESKEPWNNLDELWPNGFDVWGHKDGKPLKRVPFIKTY